MIKERLTQLIVDLDKAGFNNAEGTKPDFKTIIVREKLYYALQEELGVPLEQRARRSFRFGFVTVALGK